MGADLAYIGSAFIATEEANAATGYKDMIVDCSADDIVGTTLFTGVFGNYLRPSVAGAGLNPDDLPRSDPSKLDFRSGEELQVKAWRDIWGCGQEIGRAHVELQSLMRISYAVFCLKKKKKTTTIRNTTV